MDLIPGEPDPEFIYEEVKVEQDDYPEDAKIIALETPIYHDPETGLYYFPCIAAHEKIRAPRKVS